MPILRDLSFNRLLRSKNILKNFGYSPSNACFTNDDPESTKTNFI